MKLENKLSEVPRVEEVVVPAKRPVLLIISSLFFVLFLIEVCLLSPAGLSFRMHTEKLLLGGYFLCGFCSLHRFFFWSFWSFFILSILPMCIPVLIFFDWLANNEVYVVNESTHLEEVHHFGQYIEGLVLMENQSILFDQVVAEFDLETCNFEHTTSIKQVQLDHDKLLIQFEYEERTCECYIDLMKHQVYNTIDSATYRLKLVDKKWVVDSFLN